MYMILLQYSGIFFFPGWVCGAGRVCCCMAHVELEIGQKELSLGYVHSLLVRHEETCMHACTAFEHKEFLLGI